MHFTNPYLLNLLWILLPLSGIMVYGILRRKKILGLFARANILPVIAPKFDPKRSWYKAFLFLIAFAFAIIALAGPQMGFKWQKTTQKGVDIMIALDCSKSMLAQDIKPNRLERAKREIIDLLRMMRSDRAGLVAFSGRAILQCPLTLDHETFNIFLKVLNPGYLPIGGTNLGQAVTECYKGFEKDSDTQKAIIIITDGENTSGNVEETAKQMAKEGIKVFCIGVGDIAGAPIPDESGGFVKDEKGNIILSKVDETGLNKIADLTGGFYVRSVAGDMDLDMIYKDKILGTMERKTLTSGKKKVWEQRFQWFLFPAVFLLLIELVLSSKKKINPLLVFIFVSVLSFSVFHGSSVAIVQAKSVSSSVKLGIVAFEEKNYEQAKKHFIDAQLDNPENQKLYYNIGTAAYMNEEYEQAKTNFKHALESDEKNLRHDAQYNLANTHYRLGNFEDAINEYENILKEFPEDTKAKENLEFVKKKKQEKEQQESKCDKDKQDKNKDKSKKDQEQKDKDHDQDKQDKKNSQNDQNKDKGDNQNKQQQKDQNRQQDQQQNKQDKKQPSQLDNENEKKQEKSDGQNKPDEQKNKNAQKKAMSQNMESMLNRLEDKPGKAMMPLFQKQYIEKDW
jgi:Ca-activated chloride channel homolog